MAGKQALDIGCYGIVFPHISTVERPPTRSALTTTALKNAPPTSPGIRGGNDRRGPYWGLSRQDYTRRPTSAAQQGVNDGESLHPADRGHRGVENLDDMLKNVPGIGAILIGEGDLSQELGYPRQYAHKVVWNG